MLTVLFIFTLNFLNFLLKSLIQYHMNFHVVYNLFCLTKVIKVKGEDQFRMPIFCHFTPLFQNRNINIKYKKFYPNNVLSYKPVSIYQIYKRKQSKGTHFHN